jgi:hypothetical protein
LAKSIPCWAVRSSLAPNVAQNPTRMRWGKSNEERRSHHTIGQDRNLQACVSKKTIIHLLWFLCRLSSGDDSGGGWRGEGGGGEEGKAAGDTTKGENVGLSERFKCR